MCCAVLFCAVLCCLVLYTYTPTYIHNHIHTWQIAKIEGMEPGGFWSAVPYWFHTDFLRPGFIPRFHTLVPYLCLFAWFHTLVSYPLTLSLHMRSMVCWGMLGCPEDFGAKLILGIRDRRPCAVTLTYDLQGKRVGTEQVSRLKEIAVPVSCPVSYQFHTRFTLFLLCSAECVFAVCATACAKLAWIMGLKCWRPCALPLILRGTWLRFAMSDMSYMSDVENLAMSDISYIANLKNS